jgi:hypothetical protein
MIIYVKKTFSQTDRRTTKNYSSEPGGSKKKICDTNPLVVVVVKRGKWGNLKENFTELNNTKQRIFLLGGGGIINYVSCKLSFAENPHVIIGYIRLYVQTKLKSCLI